MIAYYNEIDPKAAAWLRELIKAGLIADGVVDERSIVDVRPGDLDGFTQCHFFAGIGGWSYALRLAGWPDSRVAWTGSCPCQPFSGAGKGLGKEDPRHLWPQFRRLVRQCRPAVVFGEQVASEAGRVWLSSVFADLEALDYRAAGADLCGPSVGAFDIRQRLWFVADTDRQRRARQRLRLQPGEPRSAGAEAGRGGEALGMADAEHAERGSVDVHGEDGRDRAHVGRAEAHGEPGACGEIRGMGYAGSPGLQERERVGRVQCEAVEPCEGQAAERRSNAWGDAEWIYCRDDKWRPIEPGTFPLAHGVSARVGRLRGYGNAIKPQVAAEFVSAYLEATA